MGGFFFCLSPYPMPFDFKNFSITDSNSALKVGVDAVLLASWINFNNVNSVLDVGCGSGSHSLYLQNKGINVKAIDISEGAIEVSKRRGVANAEVLDVLNETETFDSILLLMNGTGIFQDMSQVSTYLKHLKSLLNPKNSSITLSVTSSTPFAFASIESFSEVVKAPEMISAMFNKIYLDYEVSFSLYIVQP